MIGEFWMDMSAVLKIFKANIYMLEKLKEEAYKANLEFFSNKKFSKSQRSCSIIKY